ncbi:MAG TPA: hypothetical protein VEK79_20390 [Thermoanaerobaculia bacterium]|nr:hypothetical protein [Thermoanaerobaculia bacterium]
MATQYIEDCVAHAVRLAELLSAEDAAPRANPLRANPWIGRIRDLAVTDEHTISRPLIPVRFSGIGKPQWSTHYVCCNDRLAYDPLIGEPVSIDELALRVFGRTLEVTEAVSPSKVKVLLADGTLRTYINVLSKGAPARDAGAPI